MIQKERWVRVKKDGNEKKKERCKWRLCSVAVSVTLRMFLVLMKAASRWSVHSFVRILEGDLNNLTNDTQ